MYWHAAKQRDAEIADRMAKMAEEEADNVVPIDSAKSKRKGS